MPTETRNVSAAILLERMQVPLWLVVPLVLLVAVGAAYLGARWTAEGSQTELALRPPVVLFDMAGAVRDVPPERLGGVVTQVKKRAERLAAGGFLVLDMQAVIAAPPELYLEAGVTDQPR